MAKGWEALRAGVVLAELGGYGDGPYCATHGRGAALVILGTYIVDPGEAAPYAASFVFKPGRKHYQAYLRQHVAAARGSGALIGVSVVSVDVADSIEFLQTAEEAGAGYLSLCLHSTMEMFTRVGMSSALLRKEHWPRLRAHLTSCVASLGRPLIAKIAGAGLTDPEGAAAEIAAAGVGLVHANVGRAAAPQGQRLLRRLKSQGAFLIAGGGIASAGDARAALGAGAHAVAVATAAMQDPDLCDRLQRAVRPRDGA